MQNERCSCNDNTLEFKTIHNNAHISATIQQFSRAAYSHSHQFSARVYIAVKIDTLNCIIVNKMNMAARASLS